MKRAWLTPTSIAGLLVLYAAMYIWQPGGSRLLEIISSALYLLFAGLTTLFAWRASQMFEPGVVQRRVWVLCSISMAMWVIAETLWAYYRLFTSGGGLSASPADILWAIGYLPILVSMVMQYRALGTGTSVRLKVIALALYAGLLATAFVIVLWPILSSQGEENILETFLNLYYPIGDLSLAFVATLSLSVLWGGLVGQPWRYIVISMLLVALADLTFSYTLWNDTYRMGGNLLSGVADMAYLSAHILAAVGAYRQATLSLPVRSAG